MVKLVEPANSFYIIMQWQLTIWLRFNWVFKLTSNSYEYPFKPLKETTV